MGRVAPPSWRFIVFNSWQSNWLKFARCEMPRRHSGSDWHYLTFYPLAQMRLVGGLAAGMIPLVAQGKRAGGRPERCQRQSWISCAATLGRSGPPTAGAGHPGTANAGDGALPDLAISAAEQPTFC